MWAVCETKIDEEFSEYHVLPMFGREHTRDLSCWCKPHRDKETPVVITHETEN